MSSGSGASPLSGGGIGTIFEYEVAALVAAALLRGDRVEGLPVPITEIRLQQRIAGNHLDDIVVRAVHPDREPLEIEFQVKRSVPPIKSDREWQAFIRQCLAALRADPDGIRTRRHRLGLAASGPIPQLRELADLAQWARRQLEVEPFLQLVASEGNVAQHVRDRWNHLRGTVELVLAGDASATLPDGEIDESAFLIARALHVWIVETEGDGRDLRHVLDRLTDLLPSAQLTDANSLFNHLYRIATQWGPRAGAHTADSLRAELDRAGVALTDDARQREALGELTTWTTSFLDRPARNKLAGQLHLPRTESMSSLLAAVRDDPLVLVTGRAGAGKSVLTRLMTSEMRDLGGAVVALSLTERSWRTLADVEAELRARLGPALRAAGTATRRLLMVDGAEQCMTDAGALLRSVLNEVPRGPDGVPWTVVVTAREEAADAVTSLITDAYDTTELRHFTVGDLKPDEVDEILTMFPSLQSLNRHSRSRRLLHRPYLVDLLARASAQIALPDRTLAEEDVADLVFERLVRRHDGALPGRGAPDARAGVYLEMATALISGRTLVRVDRQDAEAIAGLVSDDLLERVRTNHRFAHDVLADYAAATSLVGDDSADVLLASSVPRPLMRATRLWMQRQLTDSVTTNDTLTAWNGCVLTSDQLARADGARWRDVPFEALLNLGPVDDVLHALAAALLADNSSQLAALIEVTERRALVHPASPSVARLGDLDVVLSAPVVSFLVQHSQLLPTHIHTAAARLVRVHLLSLGNQIDQEGSALLPEAEAIPTAITEWASNSRHHNGILDMVETLAMLAKHLDVAAQQFLIDRGLRTPIDIAPAIEEVLASQQLAQYQPALLLTLAGLYYLDRDLTTETPDSTGPSDDGRSYFGVRGEDGTREHVQRRPREPAALAHPEFGPFGALLDNDPARGLRLIGAIVDAATEARIPVEARWGQRELAIELALAHWPNPRIYRGTPHTWLWYRRLGVGPYPAMSALMALRAWAIQRVRSGTPVGEVVEEILSAGDSLALVAVTVSVLADAIDQVTVELDPFLVHPLIWHLEIQRKVEEQTSSLAFPLPDARNHEAVLTDLAALLILHSNEQRRNELRQLGARLTSNYHEIIDAEASPRLQPPRHQSPADQPAEQTRQHCQVQARRWASELDSERYTFERLSEHHVQPRVRYDQDIVDTLHQSGRHAELVLRLISLGHHATQVRDGESHTNPAELFTQLGSILDELATAIDPDTRRFAAEAVAAVAAAFIIATQQHIVTDQHLEWAATQLLRVANQSLGAEAAPVSVAEEMVSPQGPDRSAASALPLLLIDDSLRDRASVSLSDITDALVTLAGCVFADVRSRLSDTLLTVWSSDCTQNRSTHDVADLVLHEMIATAGLGAWESEGRQRIRLPNPVEQKIGREEVRLDHLLAVFAIPGLTAAASCQCEHGSTTSRLLEAIIEHDLTRWPADRLAGRIGYATPWRYHLDTVTAILALDGNPHQLRRYLAAFASVAPDLAGLVALLPQLASTPERINALLNLWPELLDALLPGNRQASTVNRSEELDKALLPRPRPGTTWPRERLLPIVERWVRTNRDKPHLADRLIEVLGELEWLAYVDVTDAVLLVLGTDAYRIRRGSQLVVRWIEFTLVMRPSAAGDRAQPIRALLDALAEQGLAAAVRLQHELEN